MKSTKTIIAATLFSLTILFAAWMWTRNAVGAEIRGYQVPALSGWQKEDRSSTNKTIPAVTFRQEVDGTRIMMKLVMMPPSTRPDTAADLAKSVQDRFRLNAKMSRKQQVLLSQATTYRGHPAYLTKTLTNKNGTATETQILRVADGKNQFWFTQSLSGQPISASARTAANKAWQTLTNDLQGVKQAG